MRDSAAPVPGYSTRSRQLSVGLGTTACLGSATRTDCTVAPTGLRFGEAIGKGSGEVTTCAPPPVCCGLLDFIPCAIVARVWNILDGPAEPEEAAELVRRDGGDTAAALGGLGLPAVWLGPDGVLAGEDGAAAAGGFMPGRGAPPAEP